MTALATAMPSDMIWMGRPPARIDLLNLEAGPDEST